MTTFSSHTHCNIYKLSRFFSAVLSIILSPGFIGCVAQKNSNVIVVQAKVWNKDSLKKVTYSDWQNYNASTVDDLTGFKSGNDKPLDYFGGLSSVSYKATGFFRTDKIDNRWWVIDPKGHPIIITAVNSIRLGKSNANELAVNTKFGSTQKWITSTIGFLQEDGFNTAGSWSDTSAIIEYNKSTKSPFVYTTQLNLLSGYAGAAKKGDKSRKGNSVLSFILDDEFPSYCDEVCKKIVYLKDDPNLLGHFSDNELPFTHTEFKEIMSVDDKNNKVYSAAQDWMKTKNLDENGLSRQDKEAFMAWLASKYYSIVSNAIKHNDPNHLYIGSRIHSSVKNNKAFFEAADPFVDILSINYYGEWQPKLEHLDNWSAWSRKPFFITEFYTKAEETGMSNISGAGWIVKTQAERGIHYQNFCLQLLKAKNCVGWHWFRYQDNDPNDATADASNKDSNKGIVNTSYEVYETLAQKMKQLNINKYALVDYFDHKK